jgi:hypothetical protein
MLADAHWYAVIAFYLHVQFNVKPPPPTHTHTHTQDTIASITLTCATAVHCSCTNADRTPRAYLAPLITCTLAVPVVLSTHSSTGTVMVGPICLWARVGIIQFRPTPAVSRRASQEHAERTAQPFCCCDKAQVAVTAQTTVRLCTTFPCGLRSADTALRTAGKSLPSHPSLDKALSRTGLLALALVARLVSYSQRQVEDTFTGHQATSVHQ